MIDPELAAVLDALPVLDLSDPVGARTARARRRVTQLRLQMPGAGWSALARAFQSAR